MHVAGMPLRWGGLGTAPKDARIACPKDDIISCLHSPTSLPQGGEGIDAAAEAAAAAGPPSPEQLAAAEAAVAEQGAVIRCALDPALFCFL